MINKKEKCLKCGHEWLPRIENPVACPNCKSRKWNEEKKDGRRE